jgi:hypothetical protein
LTYYILVYIVNDGKKAGEQQSASTQRETVTQKWIPVTVSERLTYYILVYIVNRNRPLLKSGVTVSERLTYYILVYIVNYVYSVETKSTCKKLCESAASPPVWT